MTEIPNTINTIAASSRSVKRTVLGLSVRGEPVIAVILFEWLSNSSILDTPDPLPVKSIRSSIELLQRYCRREVRRRHQQL
jgi:hypothetical protein